MSLNVMMISCPQGGPGHHQQLPGHQDEGGDAQVTHGDRDGSGVALHGELESEF